MMSLELLFGPVVGVPAHGRVRRLENILYLLPMAVVFCALVAMRLRRRAAGEGDPAGNER